MVSTPPPPSRSPDIEPPAYLKVSDAEPPASVSKLVKPVELFRLPALGPVIFHRLLMFGPTRVSLPAPPSTDRPPLGMGLPLPASILNASVPPNRNAVALVKLDLAKVPMTLPSANTCVWAASPATRRIDTASELAEPTILRTPPETLAVTVGTVRDSRRSRSGRTRREEREVCGSIARTPGKCQGRARRKR